MKPGLLRLFGVAAVVAAAVSIVSTGFSTGAAAASIVVPGAEYYNAGRMTYPNSDTQSTGGSTSAPVVLAGLTPYGSFNFMTVNFYNIPRITATAIAGGGSEGQVSSYLTYYVAFQGADGDIPVRVVASGAANAHGPNIIDDFGHNEASARFSI